MPRLTAPALALGLLACSGCGGDPDPRVHLDASFDGGDDGAMSMEAAAADLPVGADCVGDEQCPRPYPVPLDGAFRSTVQFANFTVAETAKELQFHQFAKVGVDGFEIFAERLSEFRQSRFRRVEN